MSDERGDVVWSDDPFKHGPTAARPWLVVNNRTHPFGDQQHMAVALTTSGHDAAIPIRDTDRVGQESFPRWIPSVRPLSLDSPLVRHSITPDRPYDWAEGGVPKRSYVLPWAVHSPQQTDIDHRQGRLEPSFVGRVLDALVSYIKPDV